MKRSANTLNRDLNLLSKYQLVRIYKETEPGHGVKKVIEPLFGDHKIEFKVEI